MIEAGLMMTQEILGIDFVFASGVSQVNGGPLILSNISLRSILTLFFLCAALVKAQGGQTEYYYGGESYLETQVFPHPTFPPVERFAQVKNEIAEKERAKVVACEKQKEYCAAMEQQSNLGE